MTNAVTAERCYSENMPVRSWGRHSLARTQPSKVADALGHARSAMSNWLNAKPPTDVAVANKICDYIGMDITVVIRRAEQRVMEDLSPYPPLTVDPSQLPKDEKVAYVLDKVRAGDQSLAAMNDPNKEKEAEGGDGR